MSFTIGVRHSSSTAQPVQNLTKSIAQQFSPRPVFPPPTAQPTPSIRDATRLPDHLLATIDEVLSPRADPIKQGMTSSSTLNSRYFPAKILRVRKVDIRFRAKINPVEKW